MEIAREAGDVTLRYFRRDDLAGRTQGGSVARHHRRPFGRRAAAASGSASGFRTTESSAKSSAQHDGKSGYQWVLDPIDGTKSFIHGVPLYTTLVAVLRDDEPVVGVDPCAGRR